MQKYDKERDAVEDILRQEVQGSSLQKMWVIYATSSHLSPDWQLNPQTTPIEPPHIPQYGFQGLQAGSKLNIGNSKQQPYQTQTHQCFCINLRTYVCVCI